MVKYIRFTIALIMLSGAGMPFLACTDSSKKYASDETTVAQGQQLFAMQCMSCHGLQDDGFGPPLGGITNLLSKEELSNFIKNPSKVIAVGNERAVAQLSRYKRTMPSFEHLTATDIETILAYIDYETQSHNIAPITLDGTNNVESRSGRLVAPIIKSGLKIELEEVVQLPLLDETASLGVVTLRAHPSGDGTLFASDQNGIVYHINGDTFETFLDMNMEIPDFQSGPGIATGVGSFDFHPDFLNNGLLYISHAETFKGQEADYSVTLDSLASEVQWVISEWKVEDVNAKVFSGKHRELLRLHAPSFAHGLQELAFIPHLKKDDPDYGLLYFGYGDGGSNNIKHPELGHHLKSFLGSIMRIDPAGTNSKNGNYGIPESNPFAKESDTDVVKEIYAYGFRNPHHMSWDNANGNRMIVADIGEANIEELNIVENGGDYGWPNREGIFGIATLQDLKSVFELQESDMGLYKQPFAQYDHEEGNAVSGGYVYEGNIEVLKNKYIFGDIVNGRLFYTNNDANLNDNGIYELSIMHQGKETNLKELCDTNRLHLRISYDQINKDLYLITKTDGKIWRILNAE